MTHPKQAWLEEVATLYRRMRDGDRSVATEQEIRAGVVQALQAGATWQNIGDAMGVSRQYANKRFGDHDR